MKKKSYWNSTASFENIEKLTDDISVDVLIVGGGMSGVNIAYQLSSSDQTIALIEQNKIGSGVTSKTTGKLTFLQKDIYSSLLSYHSLKTAKEYLKSQQDAISIIEHIIDEHQIVCHYEKVDSYLYILEEKDKSLLKKEMDALDQLGVCYQLHDSLPNQFPCFQALSVSNTAVFHPIKYLMALKSILIKRGVGVYEDTKLISFEKKENGYIVNTNQGKITTKHLVFATHYPYFLKPYFLPLKTHLEASYLRAIPASHQSFSAITLGDSTVSMRYDQDFLIYLSSSHHLAYKLNLPDHFAKVISDISSVDGFVWSNKDIITSDFLPLIGRIKKDENLYIATGYNTWGMTNSVIGSVVIRDLILEKNNPYIELFSPLRSLNFAKIIHFPLNVFSSLKSWIENRLFPKKSWYSKKVTFTTRNHNPVAIYTDEKGQHIVYNRCPHLKCGLVFNEVEKLWECHCHGSKFDIDGHVIEGPSKEDITYKK